MSAPAPGDVYSLLRELMDTEQLHKFSMVLEMFVQLLVATAAMDASTGKS